MIQLLLYCLAGLGVGFFAGLFGVGGGLLIVPLLVFLFQQQQIMPELIVHLSVGTSLAIILFTSVISTWSHQQHGAVIWQKVRQLSPGLMLGAGLGAGFAKILSAAWLSDLFALFEISLALFMLLNRRFTSPRLLGGFSIFSAGVGIGMVSSVVGVGGGTLTAPFLLSCRLSMSQAIGTAAACGIPIAIAGSLSFWWLGGSASGLPSGSSGYIYLPGVFGIGFFSLFSAPFGAALAHELPAQRLKYYFAGFLLLLGVHMLYVS